jgi:transposase
MDHPECQGCRERDARIGELERRVATLETQLALALKHSGNSSKPPFSDIVKPPQDGPQAKKRQRRRGGQGGHPKQERPAFAPEEIDRTLEYTLTHCPQCGGTREKASAAPRVLQQVEIIDKPRRIVE